MLFPGDLTIRSNLFYHEMRPGFQRAIPFERKITQLFCNDTMEYQDDIQDSADRAEPWTNISDFTIP